MSTLVISCSKNPDSRSAAMARIAHRHLLTLDQEAQWLDLGPVELPFCDGATSYGHPEVAPIAEMIRQADGILLATPVYNYDVNAVAKNLLELTGKSWTGKIVGLICAAGGDSSYMSLMPFANSLMLDFRCIILPRFVYATGGAFEGNTLSDSGIGQRLEQLAGELHRFSIALKGLTESAG